MMTKSTTVRGQWNCVTCLKNLSQVQLARRMNVFGINATMSEVAQLFYYMGFKKNAMNFNDFMNLMETYPSSLGSNLRTIPQTADISDHETKHEYVNDYNRYCRNTATYTHISQTGNSITSEQPNKKTKKSTRTFNSSTSQISKNSDFNTQSTRSKKQDDVIRTKKNRSNTNFDDEEEHYHAPQDTEDIQGHTCSNTYDNSTTYEYELCRTCLERSLPRTLTSNKTREATLLNKCQVFFLK